MNMKKVLTVAIFCGVFMALSSMIFAKGWPVLGDNGVTIAGKGNGGPRLAPHIHINGPRHINGPEDKISEPIWLFAKLIKTNQGIEENGDIIVRF
jgi:hypothetical protein